MHNQAHALAIKAEAMLQRMQHKSTEMQKQPAQLLQTTVGSHVHAKLDHQAADRSKHDARHCGPGAEDEVLLCAELIHAAMAQNRRVSPYRGWYPWNDARVRAEMCSLAGPPPPLCMDMALFSYIETGLEAPEAIPLELESVLEPRQPLDMDEEFVFLDSYCDVDVFFTAEVKGM